MPLILKKGEGAATLKLDQPGGRLPTKNMVIVVAFGPEIQTYIENEGHKACPRPVGCGHCGAVGRMVGHGSYRRKPKDQERAWWIRVRRWLCQVCRRTTSCLPSFLLPWRHYRVGVIQGVLVRRLEVEGSWAEVVAGCSQQGVPALRTMQRWVGALADQATDWLLAVLAELAHQDNKSPWLEPRGPTALGTSPTLTAAHSLLLASLDLLAWAKSRWRELAGYGVADRLAFLGHWGHGRRLGRLV